MVTIDPKVSAIANILVAVLGTAMSLSAEFTTIFGAGWTQTFITDVSVAAMILGAVNTALHGLSSAKPGPLVKGPPNA